MLSIGIVHQYNLYARMSQCSYVILKKHSWRVGCQGPAHGHITDNNNDSYYVLYLVIDIVHTYSYVHIAYIVSQRTNFITEKHSCRS